MEKILIVDDNAANRYMLEAGLRASGRRVASAANGAEALEQARRDPPDLVISDILMPVMDGYELCRRWKADARLKRSPFIFYTATYTDPKDERYGLRLGADRYLIKPASIETLQDAVNEVLEETRRGKAPAPPLEDEEAALREYNEVIFRKLQRKIEQLEAEAAAREQAENELKRAFDHERELARSNAELEMFAAAASHDLNAPLRKISAFAEMLERRTAGKLGPEEASFVGRIRKNAAHMSRLIGDALTLSRVSRQALPVEDVPLDAALSEVLSDLEAVLAQAGATVEREPLPVVLGHASLWRRLLQNLIANAVKFRSPERPARVVVRSRRTEDGGAIVSVEDNGIGFEPKYAQQIFHPYRRLHPSSAYEGTGMGLAICERICRRYGAEITARGEPGRGAVFSIRLPPLALAPAATSP